MIRKTYVTKRLALRPLKLSDYNAWCEALRNSLPKQDKFDRATEDKHFDKKLFRKRVARELRHEREDSLYAWGIFHRRTGAFIGWIDIATILRDIYKMANLGYFIMNHQRGQGFGREAVRHLIKVGLKDLKFHRLEAAIDIDNRASIALAKSCGLFDEGIRKHYWFQKGRWEDQRVFMAVPELFK